MILGKLNRSRKRKEGRKTTTIVVTWGRIRKRGIRAGRGILGSFFFFNEKKNEVRNVGRWFLLFFSFETKSNSLTTLNLQFSHFVSWE